MTSPQDRRVHQRFPSGRVGFVSIGGQPHQASLRDIASGGICFEVGFALEPGQLTLVELSPGRLDHPEPVLLPIRIVWCTVAGGRFQVGGKFEELDMGQQGRLAFILADMASDTPRSTRRPLTRVSHGDDDPSEE